ncbi:hypothetical protein CARUB_v10006819mg [Capsella rubella]|uniref:Uncharacterized protein n=1 Tax=Capsella rubella TaxID=81985 RepID=R0F9F9_9BRAS|nr:uncharacterized protein LOC17877385 [Capsella rubella]XP_023634588.1 uncharacterized protein LOC17877385 [Capsella rubella]XP_023634589.1 uncharacterized protein LOC17877385 [Capsella rubella]XP_023634590.1 uncharacterized protein LOC17877385 [Capsella rubella]EOA18306.1 hypothetical protein CARUB_v10006819mg [Capsella rubella]
MAKLAPVFADSLMDSWKSKACNRVPLPYLIRPRRVLPPIDCFAFYNEYASEDECDETDSPMEGVETSTLDKGHSDDEYVMVDTIVEALPNPKIEKAEAIQMMELSKDAVNDDGSESEDAGYSSDEWVVVK